MNTIIKPGVSQLLIAFLRLFFRLLYHEFAWAYDAVAAVVSVGSWQAWGQTALNFIDGQKVLELGFGPGHLQVELNREGRIPFGLDASRQMAQLARRRLCRKNFPVCLAVGAAQKLPYSSGVFDSAVSTFPSEYIFDPITLLELRRVIRPGGILAVIPAAWINGSTPIRRFWRGIFRVTGQSPLSDSAGVIEIISAPFIQAGFEVTSRMICDSTANILIILARNPGRL